ncbi:FAD-dependent oxidoreductase, partial [Nocardiopsis lucentensis]|uniref:FAD-dependent oxidoreductase n=1 Tax=Nocardiopsis lucentensis TaxID=53441 RepID=UPI000367A997
MHTPGDVVVVGGGMAAGHLVASMHRLGQAHRVTVLGAEPHAPYERPPLTKDALTGAMDPAASEADLAARLAMHAPDRLAEQGVEVRVSARVSGVDRARRTVTVEGGATVPYRHLVLATGSRPLVPRRWARRPGLVHTVHTVADGAPLRPLLRGGRVVVVGGGFVGLEGAAAARGGGCSTTVVEAGPRVLGRVCTPVTSEAVARLHREHGVRVLTGTRCVDVTAGDGGGPARLVRLDDGTVLEADLVVVGLGARPETDLAEAA